MLSGAIPREISQRTLVTIGNNEGHTVKRFNLKSSRDTDTEAPVTKWPSVLWNSFREMEAFSRCYFFPLSVLRRVHRPFQCQFFTQCDLVLPLLISSILSFPLRSSSTCLLLLPRLPATSTFPSICPLIPRIRRQCLSKMCPVHLTFF